MANTRKNRRNTRKDRKNRKSRRLGCGLMGGAKAVGTKAEVFHGTARHTSGGLYKKDLMKTKKGRIVSKKKHAAGQKAIARLRKLGYTAKKGKFQLFKKKRGGFFEDASGVAMAADASGTMSEKFGML